MPYKQLKVPEDLHWELKKLAAEQKTTMVKLLWKFANKLNKKKNEN